MRRVGLVVMLLAGLAAFVLGGGCSSSSTNEPTAQTCTAGDTRSCTGPASCKGGQSCASSGTWSACDCGDAAPSPCVGKTPLQCRACCEQAYPSQKTAFDSTAQTCACKTDSPCSTDCAASCEGGGVVPEASCLQCVSQKPQVAGCVIVNCNKNGCSDFVACITSCAI